MRLRHQHRQLMIALTAIAIIFGILFVSSAMMLRAQLMEMQTIREEGR